MTEHAGADNVHTRSIAEFVSTLTYERIPSRGARAHQAADSRLARLRHLWRAARMVSHPADVARSTRRDAQHLGLGHEPRPLLSPCRPDQRHPGAGLRARRRASPRRAPRRCGHAAGDDRGDGEPRPFDGTRLPRRRRRRLRDRPARRQVHGAGAYRPGLALRCNGRRLFGRCRRGARRCSSPPPRPCTRSASLARNRPG